MKVYPTPRRCNAAGRALIQRFEDCRLTAYLCPAGVPTIGWGEVGSGIKLGLVWSQDYADHRFELSLSKRERTVERLVSVQVTDNEFSALCSFTYNVGENNLSGSTLLRKLNSGAPRAEVAEEFRRWVFAGGRVLNGLIRRRAAERDLFLTPDRSPG
jgi:lysozyme